MIKDLCRKPTVSIIISGETLTASPPKILGQRKGRMSVLTTSTKHCAIVTVKETTEQNCKTFYIVKEIMKIEMPSDIFNKIFAHCHLAV